MNISSHSIASITEANQNFPRVARIADTYGEAIIFKNNKPKYRLVNIEREADISLTDDEKIDVVAKRVFEKYRSAFEALAK